MAWWLKDPCCHCWGTGSVPGLGACTCYSCGQRGKKNCFHTVLCFKLKTTPFSLYSWINEEQKEMILNFSLSFQAPWEEPGMEPKRREMLLRKKTTLFSFDGKKKKKKKKQPHHIWRLEWCIEEKSVFMDNCHGQNSTSNQKYYTRGCSQPLGERNSYNQQGCSKFFFFNSAEGRKPYNA